MTKNTDDALVAAIRAALATYFTKGRMVAVPEHDEFDLVAELLLEDIKERIEEEARNIKEEIREDPDSWDL